MDKLTPEQEAAKLYPFSLFDNLDSSIKKDLQRSAHITAARMYMGEVERLKDVLHIDQTGLAAGLAEVNKIVEGYRWATEGRGPYAWNDDKYKEEMGNMLDNISEAATNALNSSGAIAHSVCCEKPGRTATMEGIDYIKKDAHDKEIERLNDENHKLMAEIDVLSEELGELKNIQEGIEKLKAEHDKMRKALEEILKLADEPITTAEAKIFEISNVVLVRPEIKPHPPTKEATGFNTDRFE